jgi:endoglucanase
MSYAVAIPVGVSRRDTLLGMAAACLAVPLARVGLGSPAPRPAVESDWQVFRQRFVAPEGRVVDTGNRNVSHSEGQGYGMLVAVRAGDQGSFERLLQWTRANLRRPEDSLSAWRWRPEAQPAVEDPNNATDGDLMIAWALLLAYEAWGNPLHRRMAQSIGRDILRRCVVRVGGRWVLLPGAYGFQTPRRTVVNLSYYCFPAIRTLARHLPDPTWTQLENDGIAMLRDARFGYWSLPPDWLELPADGSLSVPANGWPARFSFDAVRIPLNLCWAGMAGEAVVSSAVRFWLGEGQRATPAWAELRSQQTAPFPASPGVVGIARLAEAAMRGTGRFGVMPRVEAASDYYGAVLAILARLAWADLSLDHPAP